MAVNRDRDSEALRVSGRTPTIILDSNFLFIPYRFGVDIFHEFERLLGSPIRCLIPQCVIDELRSLYINASPGFIKEINFALKHVVRCEIVEPKLLEGESVDDLLLRFALQTGYPVATNDSELRKRLKKRRVPVIYLRQRAYLMLEGVT
jgi:rRNA-processing protein FCF1